MKATPSLASFLAIYALLFGITTLVARDQVINIPSGTVIHVRMIDTISSDQNRAGEVFRGSLDHAVRIGNRTVVPRGATAYVKLLTAESAGHFKGRSELQLQLERIAVGNHVYSVSSNVVGFRGRSQGKKTAKYGGIGAAVGGGLGALFGGGKGAAIGAGIGGGTGVYAGAHHKGAPIRVYSESLLQFHLTAPLRIRE